MALGAALLYGGAEGLVRGSAALALRLGLTPLVVGLTVVAFGTSSAELAVSVEAAATGAGELAIGNVVGSNICNILLVLGVSALIHPMRVHAQLVRLDVPLGLGCAVLVAGLLLDGRLGRVEGGLLFAGLAAYVAFSVRQARRESSEVREEFGHAAPHPASAAWRDAGLLLAGLAALVGGSHLFVDGAGALARTLGVSQALIALTLVAVGTSLPELATSVVAALRAQNDIAVGNVVGSNLFNLLAILGLASLVRPLAVGAVSRVDLGVMVLASAALLPLTAGRLLDRSRGVLLLVAYAAYLAWLWP